MKYIWQDLPERKNYFTVKNTAMINLNTGKTVQQYCTNTKIAVIQKCVTPDKTYYRTQEAAHHYLNYAFEAEAFGLPNEKAPSAPSTNSKPNSYNVKRKESGIRTQPTKKTKNTPKTVVSNGGEKQRNGGGFSKLFRRKK